MRSRIFGLLAALSPALFVAVVHTPVASAQPRLHCDEPGEKMCLFDGANYTGNLTLYGNLGPGCSDIGVSKRSFRASTEYGGTLYETTDCKGRSIQVVKGSQNPDIGFAAQSWNQSAECDVPQTLCLFDEPDYGGAIMEIKDIGNNQCLNLDSGKQSFQAGSQREGYLYEQGNCAGSAITAVTHGQKNPDIGGVAHSFKQACVSCRARPN
ncbi:hypothetical protein BKA01_004996 [Pseudonocardia eucalypti]|nr:hypothetical protein [Pseudonocardia eucalypti]